jgi:tripartite-type tricarboxylate transporter receptor subunit TctC
VPVLAESLPGATTPGGWFGFVAPAGVPKDVTALLNRAINEAMNAPEVRETMQQNGLIIVQQSPEYFAETIRRDFARYGRLAKAIGFQPQ